MKQIAVRGYGKLNLGLEILGTDARGYHLMQMVMQSVDWFDTLTITRTSSPILTLTCTDTNVPTDETNIVLRCAKALLTESGRAAEGLAFHLEKSLPAQAGMAGGSADGAAAMVGVNRLLNLGCSAEALCGVGVNIGADIPFCLVGGTKLAEGIGERLSPLPDYTAGAFLVVKPTAGVSTKEAFAAFDRLSVSPNPAGAFAALLDGVRQNSAAQVGAHLLNSLEAVCGLAEIEAIRGELLSAGALGARMTGSGSAVFGIFPTAEAAQKALPRFAAYPVKRVCLPVKRGVEVL